MSTRMLRKPVKATRKKHQLKVGEASAAGCGSTLEPDWEQTGHESQCPPSLKTNLHMRKHREYAVCAVSTVSRI